MSDKSNETRQADWAPKEWFASQAQQGETSESAYFAHTRSGYQRYRHACLAKALEVHSGSIGRGAMLDVGCATGALTNRLAEKFGFARAVGLDFIPEVLGSGKAAYPKLEFVLGALPDLGFPDATFDLVIASEVLYYLTPDGRREAIDELTRVTKPGGHILFTSVLGQPYFTCADAERLLSRQYHIVYTEFLRMAWFHRLSAPFYYADRLETLLFSGTAPASEQMRSRYRRYERFLRLWPCRLAIQGLARLGRPLLRSEWPVHLANHTLKLGQPTNIVILAVRPSA